MTEKSHMNTYLRKSITSKGFPRQMPEMRLLTFFQSNLFIHSITTDIFMLLHCNSEAVNEHIDVNDIHKSFNKQSI